MTICTRNKAHILWDTAVGATLGRPCLSETGCVVDDEINRISLVYPNVRIDKYIIMPNHIHLIIAIETGPSPDGRPRVAPTLSQIIQQTKGIISRRVGFPIWQRSFYDHIVRTEEDYLNIWNYIDTNPIKWEQDCYYKGTD